MPVDDVGSFKEAARAATLAEVELHLEAHPEILSGKGPGGMEERNAWLDAYRDKIDERSATALFTNPDISQVPEDRLVGTDFVSAFVNGRDTEVNLGAPGLTNNGSHPARWGERGEPVTVRFTAPLKGPDLEAILQQQHPDCKILAAADFSVKRITGREPIFLTAPFGDATAYFDPRGVQLVSSRPNGVTLDISGRHVDLSVVPGTFLSAKDMYVGCAPPIRRNLPSEVFGVAGPVPPHPI